MSPGFPSQNGKGCSGGRPGEAVGWTLWAQGTETRNKGLRHWSDSGAMSGARLGLGEGSWSIPTWAMGALAYSSGKLGYPLYQSGCPGEQKQQHVYRSREGFITRDWLAWSWRLRSCHPPSARRRLRGAGSVGPVQSPRPEPQGGWWCKSHTRSESSRTQSAHGQGQKREAPAQAGSRFAFPPVRPSRMDDATYLGADDLLYSVYGSERNLF